MSAVSERILTHLKAVEAERTARAADAGLRRKVTALKAYQQRRFQRSYADLLCSERYGDAARFFLDELYGPEDFSTPDAEFARIVPALARLFPDEIVRTVERLAALHALSERLDSQMARALSADDVDASSYVLAWRTTGQPEARAEQVRLTLEVGCALNRFTRNPLLRHSLRAMRGPARAAGMSALQGFLERGFETFRAMRGAEGFLAVVVEREEAFGRALFSADAVAIATSPSGAARPRNGALGQLP